MRGDREREVTGTAAAGERRFGIEQGRRGIGSIAAEIAGDWARGDVRVRAVLGAGGLGGLVLVGATLFGLIHVVGGAWHGNPRAMGFGVALATAGMWLMAGVAALVRTVVRRTEG